MTSAEDKLRTLAEGNANLQADLGSNPFRWFDRQFAQGAIKTGTCVSVLRVSTVRNYAQEGLRNVSGIRFQIDVADFSPETARAVASDVIDFMNTLNQQTTAQEGTIFTAFLLNQRAGMYYELPTPAYKESLDFRVWNLESEENEDN